MDLLTCQRLVSPSAYPEHDYVSLTLVSLLDPLLSGWFLLQSPLLVEEWKWIQVTTFMTSWWPAQHELMLGRMQTYIRNVIHKKFQSPRWPVDLHADYRGVGNKSHWRLTFSYFETCKFLFKMCKHGVCRFAQDLQKVTPRHAPYISTFPQFLFL